MDKPNHEKIYLVTEDGVWCWSDTPAPGAGQRNVDAAEYVRADLFNQMQAECDALAVQLDEARQQHAATLNRLYEIFNIDDSDGKVRAKRALLGASNCKAERDALAAQVEALQSAYQNLCGAINDMDDCEAGTDEMETAIDAVFYAMRNGYNSVHATPQQHLAEIRAEAVDGAADWLAKNYPHVANPSCGLITHYADQVRQGEVEQPSQQETELQKAVRILGGAWPADERWSSNRFIYLIHHPAGGGYATTDSENNPNYKYICTRAEFEQAAKRQGGAE